MIQVLRRRAIFYGMCDQRTKVMFCLSCFKAIDPRDRTHLLLCIKGEQARVSSAVERALRMASGTVYGQYLSVEPGQPDLCMVHGHQGERRRADVRLTSSVTGDVVTIDVRVCHSSSSEHFKRTKCAPGLVLAAFKAAKAEKTRDYRDVAEPVLFFIVSEHGVMSPEARQVYKTIADMEFSSFFYKDKGLRAYHMGFFKGLVLASILRHTATRCPDLAQFLLIAVDKTLIEGWVPPPLV